MSGVVFPLNRKIEKTRKKMAGKTISGADRHKNARNVPPACRPAKTSHRLLPFGRGQLDEQHRRLRETKTAKPCHRLGHVPAYLRRSQKCPKRSASVPSRKNLPPLAAIRPRSVGRTAPPATRN
uniref:(northern house mosquito) hypothetical protein n=2 Tax=Culex pipiens TaxID=7175 RepID=A0A8D8DKM5_CULPI